MQRCFDLQRGSRSEVEGQGDEKSFTYALSKRRREFVAHVNTEAAYVYAYVSGTEKKMGQPRIDVPSPHLPADSERWREALCRTRFLLLFFTQ